MKRTALAFAFALVLPAAARAETPDQILKMTDDAASSFKDLTTDSKMIVKEPGASTGREYAFRTTLKGDRRLVLFTAPGDVKGMGFLVEGRDTMYAYLPGFQRVRRLGTHVKNQSFMGSDASFEDMASSRLATLYAPKLVSEDAGSWTLELTLLPGKEAEFPKRILVIDKKYKQAMKIEDYDEKGRKVRTQTRSDFKRDQGEGEHYTPVTVRIVDHRRNDHTTEIIMNWAKINQNVADDVFSQRALVRGQ